MLPRLMSFQTLEGKGRVNELENMVTFKNSCSSQFIKDGNLKLGRVIEKASK